MDDDLPMCCVTSPGKPFVRLPVHVNEFPYQVEENYKKYRFSYLEFKK